MNMEEKKEETEKKEIKEEVKGEEIEEKSESINKEELKKRSKKMLSFLKNKGHYFLYILTAFFIVLGAWIRTRNIHLLKDITTGSWLLPDLDPHLFLRYAKHLVDTGKYLAFDTMRYVPKGFPTTGETRLLPYIEYVLYKLIHFFAPNAPNVTIDFTTILYPVIAFAIAMIFFFFLVKKLFKSNVVATIATGLLSVITPFLYRGGLAGVAEKEPAAIMFMFISLFFLVYAIEAKKPYLNILFGALAGLFGFAMCEIWGGGIFLYMIVGGTFLVLFFLEKIQKKEAIAYCSWFGVLFVMSFFLNNRVASGTGFLTNPAIAISAFVFILILIDKLIFKTKLKEKIKFLNKEKFNKRILSFIIAIILIIILTTAIFGFNFIPNIAKQVVDKLISPFGTGRLTLTVVENQKPFFNSWTSNFTNILFWLLLIAMIILFIYAIRKLNKKYKFWLSSGFAVALLGIIFSNFSPSGVLNGTSILSKIVYFGGVAFFLITIIWTYLHAFIKNKEAYEKFKEINILYVFALVWAFVMVISARTAVRIFFIMTPIFVIVISSLPLILYKFLKKRKDETLKIFIWILIIVVAGLLAYSFYVFAVNSTTQAKYTGPAANEQWQRTMAWVRENTPEDAVFAHWWDYGYWVQSIGKRATVLDGGNNMPYWDYQMGRFVLCGENEQEALEVLYSHNATHFLIDRTEIGKYAAFSSIGSDENYNKFNQIGFFEKNDAQTLETNNQTIYLYNVMGSSEGRLLISPLKEDFEWQGEFYPAGKAGIIGIIVTLDRMDIGVNPIFLMDKAEAVIYYNNKQIKVPIAGVQFNNKFYDFGIDNKNFEGLRIALYTIPKATENEIKPNEVGLLLNERALDALWIRLYFFDEGKNFKLIHTQSDPIVEIIRNQGIQIGDFVYYGEVRGPIKIWEINYPSGMKVNEEYLLTNYPNPELGKSKPGMY